VTHRPLLPLVAVLSMVLLTSYGAAGAIAASFSVAAVSYKFEPPAKTVHVGDTVVWTMSGIDVHTVRSGTIDANNIGHPSAGPLNSGIKHAGESYSFTFTVAGTYPYFCEVHADSQMKGTITVLAAVATPKPTPKPTPAPTARTTPAPTPRSTPVPTPSPVPTAAVTASPISSATPPVAVVAPGASDGSAPPPIATPSATGTVSTTASDALPLIATGILIVVAILGTLLIARARRNG
jgi:plastocyanin